MLRGTCTSWVTRQRWRMRGAEGARRAERGSDPRHDGRALWMSVHRRAGAERRPRGDAGVHAAQERRRRDDRRRPPRAGAGLERVHARAHGGRARPERGRSDRRRGSRDGAVRDAGAASSTSRRRRRARRSATATRGSGRRTRARRASRRCGAICRRRRRPPRRRRAIVWSMRWSSHAGRTCARRSRGRCPSATTRHTSRSPTPRTSRRTYGGAGRRRRGRRPGAARPARIDAPASVAQWKSHSVLRSGSGVRIPPGAPILSASDQSSRRQLPAPPREEELRRTRMASATRRGRAAHLP